MTEQTEPTAARLTPRQKDVMKELSKGKTYLQISLALDISEYGVCSHMRNIFNKLGVNNRDAAVLKVFGEIKSPT